MAFQVLGLVVWGLVAVFGAWLLVTGSPAFLGLPSWTMKPWQLRIVGLVYVVAGTFLAYRAIQGTFSPEGIFFSYVIVALGVWSAWRKARTVERSQPRP